MNVGIWCDTKINLAAMKISAWHKQRGDSVELCIPIKPYDRVYAIKVFGDEYTQYPQSAFQSKETIYGGTGPNIVVKAGKETYTKDIELPAEIEHTYPDYDLFGVRRAIGFTTRGCPNGCSFCLVSEKEGLTSRKVADVTEFWRGQREIDLLDPNLLACDQHEDILQQLADTQACVNFDQGLDARRITERNAKLLSAIKTRLVHFALDLPGNTERIISGIQAYRRYNPHIDGKNITVYVLTNYNTTFREDYERVRRLQEIGVKPDVRIYRKAEGNVPRITKDLARWANNRTINAACPDFMDYAPRKDGRTMRQIYFGDEQAGEGSE